MKKLIAIAVVFALVMGGVFAETTVSGGASGKVTLGKGETGVDSWTAGEGGLSVKISGKNEEGNFGGELSFGANVNANSWGSTDFTKLKNGDLNAAPALNFKEIRSNVWWQPLDLLKVRINGGNFNLGRGGTGIFFGDIQLWQLSEGPEFNGGDGLGLYLSVFPIKNLQFDVSFPFGRNINGETIGVREPKQVYLKFFSMLTYKIDNIGTVKAAFKSNTFEYGNPASVGLAFDLSAIQNVTVGFEAHTSLPTADPDNSLVKTSQLNANLSAGFTADDFNVTLGFYGKFLGKTVNSDTGDLLEKTPAEFAVGVHPNYKFGGIKVGLGFEVRIKNIGMKDVEVGSFAGTDYTVQWQASPQLQYTVGKGTLRTGVAIGNPDPVVGAPQANQIRWQIPFKLGFAF